MNTEYNTVYGQFEKIFKEQAESFIPEDDIKITLKMEKIRFENLSDILNLNLKLKINAKEYDKKMMDLAQNL